MVSVRSSEFLALNPVFVELNWLGHPKKEKKKKERTFVGELDNFALW